MHMVVMYGSKMFTCIVIRAVCFVFRGLALSITLRITLRMTLS